MSNNNFGSQANNKGALERRLQLLESRFTTPSQAMQQPSPDVAPVLGSSPVSQHSIGFDTSSNGAVSNMSSSGSNLDKDLVRSKKGAKRTISSLDQVQLAAERHLKRIQANNSPVMDMGAFSNAASNQTVVTSHKSSQEEEAQVVAETPPVLAVSPIMESRRQAKPTAALPAKPAPVTVDKRKSIPVKRSQHSVIDASAAKSSTPASRKRTRLNFTEDQQQPNSTASRSPKPFSEHSSNSRSNPGRSKKKLLQVVTNNAKIDHFFSTVKKNVAVAESAKNKQSRSVVSENDSPELEILRVRYQELEKECKDMRDQLKAVSNNQTIMHTALKASLCQREKELEELKKSKERNAARTSLVMEKLIRVDSAREAKELRQKLASDGARLGRITYTRAGMRSVETWEEGHAAKIMHRRKVDLETKKQALIERKGKVEVAAKGFSEGKEEVTEAIDGLVLNDALSIMEAQESVRLHLDGVTKEERELREEEQSLKKEKADHIRSLKRVSSEDASRFRTRPKLNERYVLLSLLGKGGFSEVWRAFDLVELQEVAVKIHQLDPRWSEAKKDNYTKHVSREYEIHRDVRHPRIVSLYDVFEIDNNSFATVLEVCKGTDLDSLLKERRSLPERDARAILLQILSGMNYLSHASGNRQGIIHYDLKPGNILFDEFGDAKITDFGLSKIVDAPDAAESMELTSQGAGTYWYLPPECFITEHTVRISNKVDVWSIGVIYYQMLYGKRPFGDGMSQDRVLTDNTMLNAHEVRFPDSPSDISDEGKEFIRQCLTYDQSFRPTVGQICKSTYVLEKKF